LRLRRDNPAFARGDYTDLDPANPNLLCFARRFGDRTAIVLLNLSSKSQHVSPALSRLEGKSGNMSVLLTTMDRAPTDLRHATLDPFAVVILQSEPVTAGRRAPRLQKSH
jgi:hypothetical protein